MDPYFYHRVKNLNIDTLFKIVDSGYIMPRVMINTTFCDHDNVFNGNEWISLSQKVLIPPVHYFDFRSSYDEIIVGSLCIVIDGDLDNITYTDFIPYDELYNEISRKIISDDNPARYSDCIDEVQTRHAIPTDKFVAIGYPFTSIDEKSAKKEVGMIREKLDSKGLSIPILNSSKYDFADDEHCMKLSKIK